MKLFVRFISSALAFLLLASLVVIIIMPPIIVSHTRLKSTCDNVRNLSDRHLKGIAATGGLIGIAFFEPAICGTDAIATAKAIRYTADPIGIDHVALGSYFDGAFTMDFDITGLPNYCRRLT